MYIPSEVKGIKLTADEINALKEGKPVYVDGMTSKNGKPFDATLQYSAERRGLEFIYPESQGFNQQSLGGVQLSPSQIKMLSEGHTILVEDMKRTDGALFSLFCHFGQSNRTTAIHTTQSGKRRNIYPERDLQRTTDS